MTIIQPNIYVPPAIELGILGGKLIREGSVVRDAVSKQIVKHLKEVPDTAETVEKVTRATARIKGLPSKPTIITAVVVTAVAVTGVVVLQQVKKHAERNMAMPECVRIFGASWDAYREAIRDQRLDVEIIDQLISDFDAVRHYSDGSTPLDFTREQGNSVVNFVARYTSKLADANGVDLNELREQVQAQDPSQHQDAGNDGAIELRRNLAVQRKIFGDAV